MCKKLDLNPLITTYFFFFNLVKYIILKHLNISYIKTYWQYIGRTAADNNDNIFKLPRIS